MDPFTRSQVMNSVFPTGGNTLFKNFELKLKEEIKKNTPDNLLFDIINNSDKINSTFRGSHLVTQRSGFSDLNMNKKEWDENGISILYRKKMLLLF